MLLFLRGWGFFPPSMAPKYPLFRAPMLSRPQGSLPGPIFDENFESHEIAIMGQCIVYVSRV